MEFEETVKALMSAALKALKVKNARLFTRWITIGGERYLFSVKAEEYVDMLSIEPIESTIYDE